jgi:hypothetical protein
MLYAGLGLAAGYTEEFHLSMPLIQRLRSSESAEKHKDADVRAVLVPGRGGVEPPPTERPGRRLRARGALGRPDDVALMRFHCD